MLRKLFVKFHGEGEPHQADLYRCQSCGGLVTWKRIRSGETCCSGKLAPTNPKALEMLRLFFAPWTL